MKECKIINITARKSFRKIYQFNSDSFDHISDHPEVQQKIGEYLSDGWIIEGFTALNESDYVFVLVRSR